MLLFEQKFKGYLKESEKRNEFELPLEFRRSIDYKSSTPEDLANHLADIGSQYVELDDIDTNLPSDFGEIDDFVQYVEEPGDYYWNKYSVYYKDILTSLRKSYGEDNLYFTLVDPRESNFTDMFGNEEDLEDYLKYLPMKLLFSDGTELIVGDEVDLEMIIDAGKLND